MATGDASKSDDGRPVEADNMEKANFLEKEGDAAPLEKNKEKEKVEPQESSSAWLLVFCFVGLQASFLTWGYVQERVMTTDYATGRFPSSTFCVFSNRVLAIVVAAAAIVHQHRTLRVPAPMWAFAPCSLSNTLSSYGQYQALRSVSFPLQTLSKSTKVIPVMLMGKLLNRKSYRWVEYGEAGMISLGVSMFAFSEGKPKGGTSTEVLGILMLALYVVADSFTSQWQSRVYRKHPAVDQFQMMFAVNTWSILITLAALLASSEFFSTLRFLADNPAAIWDQVVISITSATGQLFIYFTIRKFGPVVFTIIMTTRQMFSMVLSTVAFGHALGPYSYIAALVVFGTIFYRIKRGGRG
jgi:adenosine 3'-phospho 5'-phosphosulfate transporter B2